MLEHAADLYERDRVALMALIIREGGRTIPAALSRCGRQSISCAITPRGHGPNSAMPQPLPGPTGERNEIGLYGRGVFACISPWNFPLSIFTGQIAAALAAGNAVIAKPAEQTPLVAAAAVRHLLAAGIPGDALHLLPGERRNGRRRTGRRFANRRDRVHRPRPRRRARSIRAWRRGPARSCL